MIRKEEQIKIEEYNTNPNLFIAKAMVVYALCIIGVMILTEVGLFKINPLIARISCGVCILVLLVPYLIIKLTNYKNHFLVKYFAITAIFVVTFMCLFMFTFHATLCLIVPLFLVTQYKSLRITRIAIIVSVLIALIYPFTSYLAGTWDMAYLNSLTSAGKASKEFIVYEVVPSYVKNIFIYMSFPQAIIIASNSVVALVITRNGNKIIDMEIEKQIAADHDTLTGLYNQNAYKELLVLSEKEEGKVGILFFDVNELKHLNDNYGHEYGDTLLKRSAASLHKITDSISTAYRVGGDEFILLIESDDESLIEKKVTEWRKAVDIINIENKQENINVHCSMAVGTAFGDFKDLVNLVHEADQRMYQDKNNYKAMKNRQ